MIGKSNKSFINPAIKSAKPVTRIPAAVRATLNANARQQTSQMPSSPTPGMGKGLAGLSPAQISMIKANPKLKKGGTVKKAAAKKTAAKKGKK